VRHREGTLLTLKIIPSTGTAYILQEYRAIMCKLNQIDVYDREKCNGWVLVQNRPMANLAGRFRVYAYWPDGQTKKKPFKLTPRSIIPTTSAQSPKGALNNDFDGSNRKKAKKL
jgi:hypothetical protein